MKKVKYERLSYEAVNALMCYKTMYDKLVEAKNLNHAINIILINTADMGLCRFFDKTHNYSYSYFVTWYTNSYVPAFYHMTPGSIFTNKNLYRIADFKYELFLAVRMRIQLLNTYIEHLNYVGDHTDFVDESGYIALPDDQRKTIREYAESKGVWKAPDKD